MRNLPVSTTNTRAKEAILIFFVDINQLLKAMANKFPVSHPPDSQKAMRERGKKKHTQLKKHNINCVLKSVFFF